MDDMTEEQTTDSFIKAIEQLEWIAKSHHDAIVRVRKLHKFVKENNAACGDPECCGEYEEWEECEECHSDYPCDTIKALDGEQ